MSIERRTLQEQLGISVNSSSLRIESRAPGGETSLLRVAGLGAAVLHVQHGADRGGSNGGGRPVAQVLSSPGHQLSPIDQVAGELAGLLWHIRYGGQLDRLHQAVVLFAKYVSLRERFARNEHLLVLQVQQREQLLLAFAERCLHEWLSDRCAACGRTGKEEKSPTGSWVRPQGNMKRNAIFRTCRACHGSGRCTPSHTARRKAIGLTLEQYDGHGWSTHFKAGMVWLEVTISRRLKRPLTVQLERSRKRE